MARIRKPLSWRRSLGSRLRPSFPTTITRSVQRRREKQGARVTSWSNAKCQITVVDMTLPAVRKCLAGTADSSSTRAKHRKHTTQIHVPLPLCLPTAWRKTATRDCAVHDPESTQTPIPLNHTRQHTDKNTIEHTTDNKQRTKPVVNATRKDATSNGARQVWVVKSNTKHNSLSWFRASVSSKITRITGQTSRSKQETKLMLFKNPGQAFPRVLASGPSCQLLLQEQTRPQPAPRGAKNR